MWKKVIHLIESEFDDMKYGIERFVGLQKPLQIQSYVGYGNRCYLRVSGRVLAKREVPSADASDAVWRNFLNITRNWLTDEVPGARLEARFQDQIIEVVADEEGYFEVEIPLNGSGSTQAEWPTVELNLVYPESEEPVTEVAEVQVPGEAEYGIISDIDDTIIKADVASILKMIRNIFLGNVHTRVVFSGVTKLYAALSRGIDDKSQNPFFYITSSPWNLYNYISEIFRLQGLPRGTLFMTDWGIDDDKFLIPSHHDHKKDAIRRVFDTYSDLNFILIGDSGQKDPEIYTDILAEYPGRVLALYIRDVTRDGRDRAVLALKDKAETLGVDLVFASDSSDITSHAVANRFIK